MPTTPALETLARSLGRTASSQDSLARLDEATLELLAAAVERRVETHRMALDRSFARVLPWPLRGPILRALRRP